MQLSTGQIFDLFIQDKMSYCSEATIRKYSDDVLMFFRFVGGRDVYLHHVPDVYRNFVVYLRSTGVRNSSIRSYCRSVSAYLRWAYERDFLPDLLKNVKLPKNDAAIQVPLYRSEVAAIDSCFNLQSVQGLRDWIVIHLMLDCGMRRQEVIHLQYDHISADKNIIQIVDSKGCKSRLVLVPDKLLFRIHEYKILVHGEKGVVLRSLRRTGAITEEACDKLFQNLKARSDIPRLHAHLLRHTFATSYLIGGGNLEFLRVFLGHTDYTVTKSYSSMAAQMKILGADIYPLDPIFFQRGY